jgi:hypothetical protein
VDISKLNLGELALVEELSGQPLQALNDPAAPKAKLTAALVYVIKKREDSKFTLAEAEKFTADEASDLFTSETEAVKK